MGTSKVETETAGKCQRDPVLVMQAPEPEELAAKPTGVCYGGFKICEVLHLLTLHKRRAHASICMIESGPPEVKCAHCWHRSSAFVDLAL